ncbi:MAG: hypothetical protein R3322_19195 [Kiloniellales bacterium]|nr:hypothetical protein [Kiloniellales bacterium]
MIIAAVAYVAIAGVVAGMHPSANPVEIVLDGLLWPLALLEFLWRHVHSLFGRLF